MSLASWFSPSVGICGRGATTSRAAPRAGCRAGAVANGIYFYQLRSPNRSHLGKIALVRAP